MSRMQPHRHQQPANQSSLDEILIRNDLEELIPLGQRVRTTTPGAGPGKDTQPQSKPAASWDALVISHGLADLVPRQRRGSAPLVLKLALLFLALVGLVGLPLGGNLLCLVLAVVIESVSYARRQHVSWPVALARPTVWMRARPPFYWTLALSIGLVALLAGESLLLSLLRVGFLWLCLRSIEDLARHPERYRSVADLMGWLDRLGEHVDRVWSAWLGTAILAIAAALAVNLIAPGIWAAVGNAGWERLLIAGGGLFLVAIIVFVRSSRSMVRAALQESIDNWDEPGAGDLFNALGDVNALGGMHAQQGGKQAAPGTEVQIEGMLVWKRVDDLVARVGPKLAHSLAQRHIWSAVLASLIIFLLAFFFLAAAVFLIIPRDVIAGWVAAGETGGPDIVLAVDDLEQLLSLEYLARVLELDWSSLGQEPVPKVVFLEAALLAALMLLRSAADRPALRRMAEADGSNVRRWMLLGTAYLVLLEEGFQYAYRGFATRQVAGAGSVKAATLRNDVLIAPSVATKASVYRAFGNFYELYGPVEQKGAAPLISVFASHRQAQDWARTFLRFPSLAGEQPIDPARMVLLEPDDGPRKFWLWSGGQMVDLMNFEEAHWYGRFAAQRA